ncbi:MAG: hypothetical protein IIY32_10230, partial [Thermoguttaceae bacterium]|nr:hypothetical protein [Thermoguttaceae bacterium]
MTKQFAAVLSLFVATVLSASTLFAQGVASIYSAMSAPIPTAEESASDRYFAPTDFLLDASGANFYVASEGLAQLRRVPNDGKTNAEGLPLSFK